ncbi:hypothetical protein CFHF_12750 [Caulobacter flavus]|uniref:Lipoprotein n=1 Tax=Caulobacter flavus TaxID=1679497 RepID=A0A2N5CT71_9CAUL|nr:hypothetical protein [Caulobacter flavus]AYV49187.1 hypothetical protein C1707_24695 [Caulobacter flavus]PLR14833.1 hypothetical protein CFHF_12750 [Caulobacter flavus]
MRPLIPSVAALLVLSACATHPAPRDTVAKLDASNPRYESAKCRKARAEAEQYNEHRIVRAVVGVGGNVVMPFAGAAAGGALTHRLEKKKAKLNHAVARACLDDPLARKAVAAR